MNKQLLVLANKIAETESNGNYNIANIVKYIKEAKIVKENIDVTTGKPFEKSMTAMTIQEVIDLSDRRTGYYNNTGGGAMGKYQFVPKTLIALASALYGDKYPQRIFTEHTQDALMMQLLKENIADLCAANIPITERSIYLMHYFGDVTRVLRTLTETTTMMSEILGEISSRHNPYIAGLTVAEFTQKKLAKYTTIPL
jgi:hypothetical protein